MGEMRLVAAAAAIVAGSWHTAPPLLDARAAHTVVAAGSAIYVLGGSNGQLDVDRFDGRKWTVATQLPRGALNAPAAVTLDGRIYVTGGFEAQTNLPSDGVEIYDPQANTWSDGPPLPAPRGGHAAVVLDGKIHLLGGGNSQSTLADHTVFDPATQTWSEAAPLPRSEGSVAAVVFHGTLYAIGGRSGPGDYGDVYLYDAAHDRWAHGPSIPPRGTGGAVVYKNAIYYVGGESQATGRTLGDVYRLTRGAPGGVRAKKLPPPRNYARAVVFQSSIYVAGGSPSAGASHSGRAAAWSSATASRRRS